MYTVEITFRDGTSWRTQVDATDALDAVEYALELFRASVGTHKWANYHVRNIAITVHEE